MIYTFFSLLGFFSLCSLNLFGFIIKTKPKATMLNKTQHGYSV